MPIGVNLHEMEAPRYKLHPPRRANGKPAAAPGCRRSRAHVNGCADAPRGRRAIAKRHFVRRRCETALCGERRKPSPGLGRDPSSVHTRASAAQLRPAVEGLQGSGIRTRVPSVSHDCRPNAAVLRLTLRGEIAARHAESCARRRRRGCGACERPWRLGVRWAWLQTKRGSFRKWWRFGGGLVEVCGNGGNGGNGGTGWRFSRFNDRYGDLAVEANCHFRNGQSNDAACSSGCSGRECGSHFRKDPRELCPFRNPRSGRTCASRICAGRCSRGPLQCTRRDRVPRSPSPSSYSLRAGKLECENALMCY
jgi:hypothetical protein